MQHDECACGVSGAHMEYVGSWPYKHGHGSDKSTRHCIGVCRAVQQPQRPASTSSRPTTCARQFQQIHTHTPCVTCRHVCTLWCLVRHRVQAPLLCHPPRASWRPRCHPSPPTPAPIPRAHLALAAATPLPVLWSAPLWSAQWTRLAVHAHTHWGQAALGCFCPRPTRGARRAHQPTWRQNQRNFQQRGSMWTRYPATAWMMFSVFNGTYVQCVATAPPHKCIRIL